ncbi:Periplasmic protein TonB [Pseudomonas orientalis]|uniref:STY4534 family ICE replication protein n=1 Tax=Pseudomonas orientalis TaxID=76758 RepID=UPI000F56DB43|nr:STY4534 family ICE replication protein [Pseudomonas orientalis]AZE99511.1 Periplasmic protein TonB [Pseudomonas orientalis]
MSQSSAVAGEATYFDLHTQGLGYLNRIREVTPSRGKAFLACTIAALNGPTESPEYRYFDVTVCGAEARQLVNRYAEAVEQGHKVLMGFRLGDLWTDLFRYSRGEKAGKTGVSLKARLLFVSWVKVNGKLVYQARPKAETDDTAATPAADASAIAQSV